MGKYQVEAALKVAVASEATESVNSLGNLIKQQNQAQIEQNKLIAKVLKEVTEARKKDKTEIVQVERKQRDVTANMNKFTASVVKAKGAVYDYTIAIRNLGESIAKGLTFWAPWVGWIKEAVGWMANLATAIGPTKQLVDDLRKSIEDINNIKPIDPQKIFKPNAGTELLSSSGAELRERFGDFYSPKDIREVTPEKELAGLYQQQDEFIAAYNYAADNIGKVESKAEETVRKWSDITKKLTKEEAKLREITEQQQKTQQAASLAVTDGAIAARAVTIGSDSRRMKQMIVVNKLKQQQNELDASIVALYREIQRMRDLLGKPGDDALFALQKAAAEAQARIEGARNRNRDKTESLYEDFYKEQGDNFDVFIEYWEKSFKPAEEHWYDKLFQGLEEMKKQIPKYIHTDIGRAFAMSYLQEGFDNYFTKALEERRKEYKALLEKVFPEEDTYLKERTKALEKPLEYIKDRNNREMGFNWMPLTHISDEDKAKIEKQIQENSDWYQDRMSKISQERAKKLEDLEKRRKQFEEFDVTGLGVSPEERLAQLQKFEDEKLQIKLDALNEEERVKAEYAERDKGRRKAEVEAFGNMFRIVDKNSEAWKKSDEAMNTMVTAVDTLGFSEKKVFALQNYAKGIEASVDAINCQADAIIKFGLGDIKGGIALQAAAVAKGIAAYSYFKNSMEMGGKGGSAPSVGTAAVTGTDVKERDITINMAFEGTAGAIIRPLADAFNQQATVPGGVRLNSRLVRA